ncbi:hypothetical protein [Aquitalea magnusonii]|uniref:hypothetical protein n=1 Tax=Aquitalea magnusonii TaxID=332411 RepID=UPI0011AE97ED|nr:hypothetical protein [Aquitalea magnusonii]
MLRILTIAAIFLLAITAHAAQSQENPTAEIDKIRHDCYSSREKNEFIFITFGLFDDRHLGGFVQHNNGPIIHLRYLYPEYVDMTGAGNDTESHTYAEMMNNKISGYYTYTWYRGDSPKLKYHSKKKNKPYFLGLDSGAEDSEIPDTACDWSKSSRLSEEESN